MKYPFFFALILTFIIISCGDNKEIRQSDLEKYPWIQVFIPKMQEFKGDKHNLDLGTFSFTFTTVFSNQSDFFQAVDSAAIGDGWEIIIKEGLKHEYSKPSTEYEAANHLNRVTLLYDSNRKLVTFKLTPIHPNQ